MVSAMTNVIFKKYFTIDLTIFGWYCSDFCSDLFILEFQAHQIDKPSHQLLRRTLCTPTPINMMLPKVTRYAFHVYWCGSALPLRQHRNDWCGSNLPHRLF